VADPQDDLMKMSDLKLVLALAEKQPVNCAFALMADRSALLVAHKQTTPKILAKQIELKAKSADKNSLRFGKITVDAVNDPGTLKFAINKKEIGGTVTGLVKLAKRAGYQAVVLNEDPTVESGAAAAAEPSPAAAAPAQPIPPPPPPPSAARPAPSPDWLALGDELEQLTQQIPAAAGEDKDAQQRLAKLAKETKDLLARRTDYDDATKAVEAVRRALAAAGPAGRPTAPSAAAAAPAAAAPSGAGPVTYAKSRLAWLAARKKVASDIEKLRVAIADTYKDDGIATDLDKAFRNRVAPVLSSLDERLANALDDATNEADPVKRAKLVSEAKKIIIDYTSFLERTSTISDLDSNPFVPLNINDLLSNTLSTLAKAIR
jgi:hypothetical protein